ncbi:MAG: 3-phosphoglycerate kinase [Candidatus Eremiobacteraeota bacterium]|nr:3-phosphoglycerate kinase [Candidatus Eremiobacteraeota bacterium]
MHFRTLRDVGVRGKRVLLREDLNVPMKDGAIADETRIDAALPTLRRLRDDGAKTVILSHLGRPDGKTNPKYSLRPLAARLSELLGTEVRFVEDCIGDAAVAASNALADGGFALFENVRFHPEEEANDPGFARELAKSGDLYVNDAFGTAHRAHASTAGVAAYLPAYAGLLMEAELAALSRLMGEPARPFVCAIGGAKVVDKVGVFENLLANVDAFVIGGGMANTFLAAQGIDVGTSLRDPDLLPAQRIIATSLARGVDLHLPTDAVVADSFDADDTARTVPLEQVGGGMILDIGPETARAYAEVLRRGKTIVFNGPMGVYEKPPYQNGTLVVGEAIGEATRNGAISVIGGGDAAAAAHALGFANAVTHVSTGGGATLEFLEGKTLPGVAALEQSAARS